MRRKGALLRCHQRPRQSSGQTPGARPPHCGTQWCGSRCSWRQLHSTCAPKRRSKGGAASGRVAARPHAGAAGGHQGPGRHRSEAHVLRTHLLHASACTRYACAAKALCCGAASGCVRAAGRHRAPGRHTVELTWCGSRCSWRQLHSTCAPKTSSKGGAASDRVAARPHAGAAGGHQGPGRHHSEAHVLRTHLLHG